MKSSPATLLQLLAALSRLKVCPPVETVQLSERREALLTIEKACTVITCFIEMRLEQLRGKPNIQTMTLYDLRRTALDLGKRVHSAAKAREPGPLDKIRRAYDTLGTSLKRLAEQEKDALPLTVDAVLHLPMTL